MSAFRIKDLYLFQALKSCSDKKRLNKFVGCKVAEVIFVKNIHQKIFIRGYKATLTQIKRCHKSG